MYTFFRQPPLANKTAESFIHSCLQKMSCCCDENDDESTLTAPLSSSSSSNPTVTDSTTVTISPMNSHFAALMYGDTLRLIFEKLSLTDLARASCVCKAWNSVASDDDMIIEAFMAPWKLLEVVGKPSSRSFWRDNGIGKFAISHRILRGETVASLAVKYSVQVMDIKRLNNMMSDHGIYSRERLLIPISNPDILVNGTCYIELDTYAKREVAVLYLDGKPEKQPGMLLNRVTSERGKRRVIDSLKRSMQVDDGTAQYYLSISDGDPRAALSQFSSDLRWERQTGLA